MNLDYTLTEKDVRMDVLTPQEREQLQENKNGRNDDYMNFYVQDRDKELAQRHSAILDDIARKAGFDGYHKNGSGNSFMECNERADETESERIQLFHRLKAESPEYAQFQRDSAAATAEDMRFFADSTQEMYIEALRISIPRLLERGEKWTLPPQRKPVILRADDVYSMFLYREESAAIENDKTIQSARLNKQVFEPVFKAIHRVKDAELDRLAREVGFDQFDENDRGTGLRNYTALGKPATPAIKQQIERYSALYDASPVIRKCLKDFSALSGIQESMIKELNQVMLRNILALTNERITRYDAAGKDILPPDVFLKKMNGIDNKKQRDLLKAPYTATVTRNREGVTSTFRVDKGIAPFIQQLTDAGYVTGQSCSGLLEDHPNYRYVEDSRHGLYVEGEPIHYNKQGSGTYLTFYKPVEGAEGLNISGQIDNILSVAAKEGWIVEDMPVFGIPSVRLCLPLTYDGYGKREILREAGAAVNREHPGLEQADFFRYLEVRSQREKEVWQRHGGVVRWTDQMVYAKWNSLTQALVKAERQRQEIERITDVRTFLGGDGHWRIKCRIDGVDQLSEHLADVHRTAIDKGADKREIAHWYYEERFVQQQGQDKGLKR